MENLSVGFRRRDSKKFSEMTIDRSVIVVSDEAEDDDVSPSQSVSQINTDYESTTSIPRAKRKRTSSVYDHTTLVKHCTTP